MNVPFMDLWSANREIFPSAMREIEDLVRRSQFIGGEKLTQFEDAFAQATGAAHCAGISNGTASLELALKALAVGPGDEVITVSHSFAATVESVIAVGATPVLVDVEIESGLIDTRLIEEKITSKTKALLPVHLYGFVADLDSIFKLAQKHDLAVLQDAAQAHGALWKGKKLGSFPGMQSYSFYPGKNIGAWGDAGALTGNDPEEISLVKALRNHGRREGEKYSHHHLGVNERLDPLQALVLTKKLATIEEKNRRRRELYSLYRTELEKTGDVEFLRPHPESTAVHHLCVIKSEKRDALAAHLAKAGISTGIHYPEPIHAQAVFHKFCRFNKLPRTESLCRTILSLPFFPEMSAEQFETVVKSLRSYFA